MDMGARMVSALTSSGAAAGSTDVYTHVRQCVGFLKGRCRVAEPLRATGWCNSLFQ